jgi:hypothetical protein
LPVYGIFWFYFLNRVQRYWSVLKYWLINCLCLMPLSANTSVNNIRYDSSPIHLFASQADFRLQSYHFFDSTRYFLFSGSCVIHHWVFNTWKNVSGPGGIIVQRQMPVVGKILNLYRVKKKRLSERAGIFNHHIIFDITVFDTILFSGSCVIHHWVFNTWKNVSGLRQSTEI